MPTVEGEGVEDPVESWWPMERSAALEGLSDEERPSTALVLCASAVEDDSLAVKQKKKWFTACDDRKAIINMSSRCI